MVALDNTIEPIWTNNFVGIIKMKKEEMDKKFEKLSDINKIRFNLGNIILLQYKALLFLILVLSIIFSYILFLPLLVLYGDITRIVMMAFLGVLLMFFVFTMFLIGIYKLHKQEKESEEFLNKKSKK